MKASGSNLETLDESGIAECRFDKLLPMIESKGMDDAQIDQALFDARVNLAAKKPSVESLFHAWLLGLPGVQCVGHVHAIAVNQILCSPRAKEFARKRIFPDEIVCCGCESVFVPYTDPGLALAQVIREKDHEVCGAHEARATNHLAGKSRSDCGGIISPRSARIALDGRKVRADICGSCESRRTKLSDCETSQANCWTA